MKLFPLLDVPGSKLGYCRKAVCVFFVYALRNSITVWRSCFVVGLLSSVASSVGQVSLRRLVLPGSLGAAPALAYCWLLCWFRTGPTSRSYGGSTSLSCPLSPKYEWSSAQSLGPFTSLMAGCSISGSEKGVPTGSCGPAYQGGGAGGEQHICEENLNETAKKKILHTLRLQYLIFIKVTGILVNGKILGGWP